MALPPPILEEGVMSFLEERPAANYFLDACSNASRTGASHEAILLLKYYSYGIAMPLVCTFGVIGNALNLIVLTRPSVKGTAYVYMRGYAAAALLAALGAFPFCVRILVYDEVGRWSNRAIAFYHVYLELYVGNACLGTGMLMLVALTTERYVAICFPARSRKAGSSRRARAVVLLIPAVCFACYVPYAFGGRMVRCLEDDGSVYFQKKDNLELRETLPYRLYQWLLECVFRFLPAVALAYLNIAITISYRRVVHRRRAMKQLQRGGGGRCRGDQLGDRRILFLLGSTSTLFFVCIIPVMVVSLMMSEKRLSSFTFQACRAVANILEVTSYALTFYVYFLFSKDFRRTFLRTMRCALLRRGWAVAGRGRRTDSRTQCFTKNNAAHTVVAVIQQASGKPSLV